MTRHASFIRPATSGDYSVIARVLDGTLGKKPFEQRMALWKWRYDGNPSRTDAFPTFLVVEEDGRIVGVHGLIPLRLKAGEKVLDISCSCDLAVDVASRSAGMKLKLAALAKNTSPLHLSTSANGPACKITVALGGKEVSRCRRKWILPLRASGLLRRELNRKGKAWEMLGTASAVIGKPIDWTMDVLRSAKRRSGTADGEIGEVRVFDERYDRFWEEWARKRTILLVRDSQYLNWRYSGYPFPGIRSFELTRNKELQGFTVIHLAHDEDRLRFAAVLELAGRGDDNGVRERLLDEAVRCAASNGAHYLIARASLEEDEVSLRKAGFLKRDLPHSPVTYKNNSDVSGELLADDRNWYVTLGDGDGCHYYES